MSAVPRNFWIAKYVTKDNNAININLKTSRFPDFLQGFAFTAKQNGFPHYLADVVYSFGNMLMYYKQEKYVTIKNPTDLKILIKKVLLSEGFGKEAVKLYINQWALIKALLIAYYSNMRSRPGMYLSVMYYHESMKGKIKASTCLCWE